MALSGTTSFTLTRDEIILAAARTTGYIALGETLEAEDLANRSQALNIMVKGWAKPGQPLWVTQEVLVPLVAGVATYQIGQTAGYVHSLSAAGGSGYSAGGTWTATDGTAGTAASGTYTVAAGVIDSMTVLVPGDSYTSAPTTFTLSGPGTSAVITAVIVGVTTHRPLRTLPGTFLRKADGTDVPLLGESRTDYNLLGSKTNAGVPNQYYYNGQLANGLLTLNPVPDTSTDVVHLQVQRHFFDLVSGTDNFDFPQEWLGALKYGLAAEMGLEDGVSSEKLSRIEFRADRELTACFDQSVEEESLYFTVNTRG